MAGDRNIRRFGVKKRIRRTVKGTPQRPRLCIFRSNRDIYAQLVDDSAGRTILAVSSRDKDVAPKKKGTKTEQASLVGRAVAEKARAVGIENVVFDRGGYLYHGRVQSLADAARAGGLKF